MGNNAGQLALLAAGYLLGKSKSMRTVLMVAGGVAYGRLTAPRSEGDDNTGSLLSRLGGSGIADTAREVLTTTAVKGAESLNKNLQSRSEALRGDGTSDEDAEDDTADQESAEDEAVEETEESEEAPAKATKGGDS